MLYFPTQSLTALQAFSQRQRRPQVALVLEISDASHHVRRCFHRTTDVIVSLYPVEDCRPCGQPWCIEETLHCSCWSRLSCIQDRKMPPSAPRLSCWCHISVTECDFPPSTCTYDHIFHKKQLLPLPFSLALTPLRTQSLSGKRWQWSRWLVTAIAPSCWNFQ